MPLPLAPLTATGDAGDPTTMRTACVVAAATVTATWWRGARSSWRPSWCALFLSLPFLCADGFAVVRWGCMSGPWWKGGQGVYPYTRQMHYWRLFESCLIPSRDSRLSWLVVRRVDVAPAGHDALPKLVLGPFFRSSTWSQSSAQRTKNPALVSVPRLIQTVSPTVKRPIFLRSRPAPPYLYRAGLPLVTTSDIVPYASAPVRGPPASPIRVDRGGHFYRSFS